MRALKVVRRKLRSRADAIRRCADNKNIATVYFEPFQAGSVLIHEIMKQILFTRKVDISIFIRNFIIARYADVKN
jgi:hypothetical protein